MSGIRFHADGGYDILRIGTGWPDRCGHSLQCMYLSRALGTCLVDSLDESRKY